MPAVRRLVLIAPCCLRARCSLALLLASTGLAQWLCEVENGCVYLVYVCVLAICVCVCVYLCVIVVVIVVTTSNMYDVSVTRCAYFFLFRCLLLCRFCFFK